MARAAVSAPGRHGMVLVGPPGVGKSYVLARAAAALEADGVPVVHLIAEPTLAPLPFATFRTLLPAIGPRPESWAELVRAGIDLLTAPPDRPPTVVVVDDVQHLDAGSVAILHQGLLGGRFRLLGSLRSGVAVPESVSRLWSDGLIDREDLRPLDRPAAAAYAGQLLGGPLEGASEQRLWRWTQGNPLFLRELLASARAAGSLQRVRGLWRIRGEVAGSEGLRSLLELRLTDVTPGVRQVAEALAVADGLPAAVLEQLAGDAVAEAERAGVITVSDDRRLECRLAHPLHGEVLRHELGRDRIRQGQELLIDMAAALPEGAVDPMLLAIWHLETDRRDPGTVALLAAAARAAWVANDSALTARLSRQAWRLGGDTDHGIMLCEALLRQGRGEEMAAVSEAVLAAADDDGTKADAVSYIATAKRIWANRPEEAIELAERYAEKLDDPVQRVVLDLLVATAELDRGRPARAVELARIVLETGSPHLANAAAIIVVPALAIMGELDEAIRIADHAIATALGAEGQPLNDLGSHLLFRVDTGAMQGGLAEAATVIEASYEQVAAAGDTLALAWLTFVLARIEVRRGRMASALTRFQEAAVGFADLHRLAWETWAQAGIAQCHALLGERAPAHAAAERIAALRRWHQGMGASDVRRALAWISVSDGDVAGAVAEMHAALDDALAHDERFIAAVILNDLGRLGDHRRIDDLRTLAATIPSRLVAAWAARAEATLVADGTRLAEVADLLAREGARLEAGEVEGLVADLARTAGDERGAAAAVQRAVEHLATCEGVRTPSVAAIDRPALTRRENDVARLAAAGASRRAIATDLYLSVRTVDSHLQRVYRKLGVSTSAELARVLQPGAVDH